MSMPEKMTVDDFARIVNVTPGAVYQARERHGLTIVDGVITMDRAAAQYREWSSHQRHDAQHARARKVHTMQITEAPELKDDDSEDDVLTHEEVIVLVNDCFAMAESCVDCSALGETFIAPGAKAMLSSEEQKKLVSRLVKAVRSNKSNVSAKKAVVSLLRAAARKLVKDLREQTVFFRHYAMETEDRFTFTPRFKPDAWDKIATMSDDNLRAPAPEKGKE